MLGFVMWVHGRSCTISCSSFMLVRMLKFVFLYACIDMTSPEVVYLSSDDEPIFERNQRLLKEHHEREEHRHIQDHLSRLLEEVEKR